MNLVPNSITLVSVFVYLCEAYLGILPDLDLFLYYYGMGKHSGITGRCGLKLHDGKSREYIQMFTRSLWPRWKKRWFYWTLSMDDSLFFTGKPVEKSSSWDSAPSDLDRITPYILAIKDLREEGLTG